MMGRPPPLPNPAIGVLDLVSEDLAGLGPRGLGQTAQTNALQMIRNDLAFKGRLTGQCLLGGRFDARRSQRQGVEQAAAQTLQLFGGDRQLGQLLGQGMQERRPLDQGAEQSAFLARGV